MSEKQFERRDDKLIGLGKPKGYYCKGDYIWLNDEGEITSNNRREFYKGGIDGMSNNCHDCWLLQRKYVSRHGFLYRCMHTDALTTKELQENCPKK